MHYPLHNFFLFLQKRIFYKLNQFYFKINKNWHSSLLKSLVSFTQWDVWLNDSLFVMSYTTIITFASRIYIGINDFNCSCPDVSYKNNRIFAQFIIISMNINLILLLLTSLVQIYLEKNDLVWTLSYTLISKEYYFKF